MKLNRFVLTGVLTLAGVLAAVYPVNLRAQTDYDIFQNAFQTTVQVNAVTNFNYTAVAIPAGKRLVIQFVSISGAAQSSSGLIQPIVILESTLGTGSQNLYYFAPPADSQGGSLSSQFYATYPTTIYADTLDVGPAYAGFSPTYEVFNVTISGYLVAMPDPPPAPTLRARPEL